MSTQENQSLDKLILKKLTRLYMIALSLIAISIVISHIVIDNQIDNQAEDSYLINLSGRQRMLSQKLSKEVLLLQKEKDPVQAALIVKSLEETLKLWSSSHEIIIGQDNSEEVVALLNKLSPYYDSIKSATALIIDDFVKHKQLEEQLLNARITIINLDESLFLELMDQIVNQYEAEASSKLASLRSIEYIIFGITIIILILEFLFVYNPAASYVESVISKLLVAEKNAIQLAKNADQMSEAKEASVRELRALNYAMDQTLLFSRTTLDGEFTHLGDNFSKLFGVNAMNSNLRFSQVLTSSLKDRNYIDQIIINNNKSGWQGQLKILNKKKEHMWLDTTIIPVTVDSRSELLIICFDITERKIAQLEVERLSKEQFENEMNQQKILSSKIVENQENEQNRIAKEIHDGIGQMLTGLKFSLESIDLKDIKKTEEKITYLKDLSTAIIKGVRTATFNLMPPELKDHGIASSLLRMSQELKKLTGQEIIFINKTDFNQRLDSLAEINIYRITQEAINNAIKYANADHIVVMISHSDDILSITIDDDGDGFDPAVAEKNKTSESGMGMEFMRERISYIKGRIFLNSVIGEGTHLTLNIPLKSKYSNV